MKTNLVGIAQKAVANRKLLLCGEPPRYLMERAMPCGQRLALWVQLRPQEVNDNRLAACALRAARVQLRRMIEINRRMKK